MALPLLQRRGALCLPLPRDRAGSCSRSLRLDLRNGAALALPRRQSLRLAPFRIGLQQGQPLQRPGGHLGPHSPAGLHQARKLLISHDLPDQMLTPPRLPGCCLGLLLSDDVRGPIGPALAAHKLRLLGEPGRSRGRQGLEHAAAIDRHRTIGLLLNHQHRLIAQPAT